MRRTLLKPDVRKTALRTGSLFHDQIKRSLRNIDAEVVLGLRRDAVQEQAGSAADFPYAPRLERENAVDRGFHPDTHFLRRNRLTGVAAVPARDIEGGVIVA